VEWLIPALIFLAFVMLVGHGLWVFLAFIFRSLLGEPRAAKTEGARCPNCERPLTAGESQCRRCGHRLALAKTVELADLDAVERQLQRWRDRGQLKPRLVQRLLARVQAYRRELLRPRGAAIPAAQQAAATLGGPEHAATTLARQRQRTTPAAERPIEAILAEAAPDKPFAGLAAAASAAAQPQLRARGAKKNFSEVVDDVRKTITFILEIGQTKLLTGSLLPGQFSIY